jgi:O-acetyl-ADP-ribose deacetylase
MVRVKIGNAFFEIVQGDITKQSTEAIVNAANEKLSPGGGVSGAIHKAAGERLWDECKNLGGCRTGKAKITRAYNLPSKYVIHTVGPVYSNEYDDELMLSSCYYSSLSLADSKNIKSISFPAISTGAFGYPMEEAGEIALQTIMNWLRQQNHNIKLVRLVLFDKNDYETHDKILKCLKNNEL